MNDHVAFILIIILFYELLMILILALKEFYVFMKMHHINQNLTRLEYLFQDPVCVGVLTKNPKYVLLYMQNENIRSLYH